jgi:hydrogenase nickel incorporation protein HypA/HybF
MHELGIVQEVIDLVTEHARGARVKRVVLEIGKLTAVSAEAIRFSFDVCRADTVAEGAELQIVETPGRARCQAWGANWFLKSRSGVATAGASTWSGWPARN